MNMQEKVSRNKSILKDYKEGVTLQQVGNKYGLTRERVRQIVTKAGQNKSVFKYREHQQFRIYYRYNLRDKYNAGIPMDTLRRRYKISVEYLRRFLVKDGAVIIYPQQFSAAKREEIVNMYCNATGNLSTIGRHLKVDRHSVLSILREYGFK